VLPAWAQLCFLISGAAGLLYEVAWSKQLSYLLGNSLQAVATVVAAFLCGLALGARFLGTPLSRKNDGARWYAKLEVGVAILGLVSLPVLRGLDPLVGQLYRSLGGETGAFALARVVLLFLLLLPPAAMMGATLPVLVGHFESHRVGPGLARLYAINTLGAVIGSASAGFLFLPTLGLLATTAVAAALNLAAALLAWRAGVPGRAAAAEATLAAANVAPASGRSATEAALTGRRWPVFAVLFALSGFAALVFQIAWVRLFSLVFGSSVYSFSAVLGIYLLGLALGSALVARFMRSGVSLTGFGALQLGLALIAALMLHAFSRMPDWMLGFVRSAGSSWTALFTSEITLTAFLLLAPCALLGALFPIATRLLQREHGGPATGFAYAVNTAGTIAGSLFAGFWAVPSLGVQGTHLGATLLSAVLGTAAIALGTTRRGRDLALAGAALAGVAALAFTAPRWDPALMSAGAFRPTQAANLTIGAAQQSGPGSEVWRATRAERVLFYREGMNGTVYVGTDAEGKERWMRIGGKTDASTGDMDTQILLGVLPAALADSGARSMVIGHGSGATTAAVLAAGAGPTEVLELETAVLEGSRWFHAPGEDPLDDPRVTVIVGDARTRLAHGGGRYGLIVSQPSNPWIAGINNLFTVDFYRRVKSRLTDDGVFCQWMQLYEMSPPTFASMVASFLEVFPDAQVVAVWKSVDVMLIAAPTGRSIDLGRLRRSAAVQRALDRAQIRSPDALASYYAGPLEALRPITRGATLNRDDRPVVEYRAPRDLIAVGTQARGWNPEVQASIPFAARPPDNAWFAEWTPEQWHESRIRALIDETDLDRAAQALANASANGFPALARRLAPELDAGVRRRQGLDLVEQAMAQIRAGRGDEARATLAKATDVDPANGRTWLMLGDRLRLAGDVAGAEAAFARGKDSSDPEVRADAANLYGLLEMSRQRHDAAAEHFREAQRILPAMSRSYVLEARAWTAAGRPEDARLALRRGLERDPGNPGILAALAEIGAR
jgi:spermidine synthase